MDLKNMSLVEKQALLAQVSAELGSATGVVKIPVRSVPDFSLTKVTARDEQGKLLGKEVYGSAWMNKTSKGMPSIHLRFGKVPRTSEAVSAGTEVFINSRKGAPTNHFNVMSIGQKLIVRAYEGEAAEGRQVGSGTVVKTKFGNAAKIVFDQDVSKDERMYVFLARDRVVTGVYQNSSVTA